MGPLPRAIVPCMFINGLDEAWTGLLAQYKGLCRAGFQPFINVQTQNTKKYEILIFQYFVKKCQKLSLIHISEPTRPY